MIVNTVCDDIDDWPLHQHPVWLRLSWRFTHEKSNHASKYIKIHVDMELALPKDYYLIIFICWLLSSCVKLFWINSEANSRQCHATIKNPPRSMQEVFGIIKESLWYIVEGRGASKSTHFNIQIT